MNLTHEERLQTICLFILSGIAIAGALYWLRPVMVPFVLAIFFTILLNPFIDLQKKYLKVPHRVATWTTLFVGIILFILFGILVSLSLQELASNTVTYQAQWESLLRNTLAYLDLQPFGIHLDLRALIAPSLQGISESLGRLLLSTVNSIIQFLSQGVLVFIFVTFLLLGRSKMDRPRTRVFNESLLHIKRYIVTKVVISLVTGIVVGLILMALRVPLALVFGLAAFVLNFIPNVGSIIATLLPLPVVWLTPDTSWVTAVLAIGLPGLLQFLSANFIETKVMGDYFELHPVVVLMALIFWGMLWGMVGMLLAVPLTSIMKIILADIELTRPLAHAMAGRFNTTMEAK
jgi:AI-2 transport protein TqsA